MEIKKTTRRLERYQTSVLILRPSIRLKSHLFQANKQIPRQSLGRLFWDKKNTRADS